MSPPPPYQFPWEDTTHGISYGLLILIVILITVCVAIGIIIWRNRSKLRKFILAKLKLTDILPLDCPKEEVSVENLPNVNLDVHDIRDRIENYEVTAQPLSTLYPVLQQQHTILLMPDQ